MKWTNYGVGSPLLCWTVVDVILSGWRGWETSAGYFLSYYFFLSETLQTSFSSLDRITEIQVNSLSLQQQIIIFLISIPRHHRMLSQWPALVPGDYGKLNDCLTMRDEERTTWFTCWHQTRCQISWYHHHLSLSARTSHQPIRAQSRLTWPPVHQSERGIISL